MLALAASESSGHFRSESTSHRATTILNRKQGFSPGAMLPLLVLNFLVIASGDVIDFGPAIPCTTTLCRGCEWRNNWSPSISQGKCVKQHRTQHCSHKVIHGSNFCPTSVLCSPKTQYRTMCKYAIVLFVDE